MMMKKCLIGLFLLFAGVINLGNAKSSSFLENINTGEKNWDQFTGTTDPAFFLNFKNDQLDFSEKKYRDDYFESLIERDFFLLKNNWFYELPKMSACPVWYLDKNSDYLRYLFRLLTMSYLYEGLKDQGNIVTQLKGSAGKCSTNWSDLFQQCRPDSRDMKTFLRRSKIKFLGSTQNLSLDRFSSKEYKTFLKKKKWKKNTTSLVSERLGSICKKNNCHKITRVDLGRKIERYCEEEKDLVKTICSEKDDLYGLSSIDLSSKILINAEIMKAINEGGIAKNCVESYRSFFSRKERQYDYLPLIYDKVYSQLRKNNDVYLQGELFIPGALKEFDDKGLADFLFVKPKPVVKKKKTPPPIVKKVVVKKVPKPKKVMTVKKKPVVKKKPKVVAVKYTEFENAYLRLKKNKLKSSMVKMDLFKNDFIFDKELIKRLDKPLKTFQTREALGDMKTYDKLGNKKEPIRLKFIKYFIDQNYHQGLWNIKSIIGDTFYIINDIDPTNTICLIELVNSKDSGYQWQIIIRDDQK